MTEKKPASPPLMEKIVALCKRRGFVFQSSEIYGGINGFWDYGPAGAELKRNIKDAWWNDVVRSRTDVVGLDASIIMHPKVWEASGHVDGFRDPMVECMKCKGRWRADQVWDEIANSKWFESLSRLAIPKHGLGSVSYDAQHLLRWATHDGKHLAPELALVRDPQVTLSRLSEREQKQPGKSIPLPELLSCLATLQAGQTGLQTPCPVVALR